MRSGAIAADLRSVLDYRNDEVVSAFCDSLAVEQKEAELIFCEMLKFLWLCHVEEDKDMKTIDSPILILDEMWHAFILFTREYHEFSARYFGRYIHHAPSTLEEKRDRTREPSSDEMEQLVQAQRTRYSKIYDRLGRDTFVLWFLEFPKKYPASRIRELRRK